MKLKVGDEVKHIQAEENGIDHLGTVISVENEKVHIKWNTNILLGYPWSERGHWLGTNIKYNIVLRKITPLEKALK